MGSKPTSQSNSSQTYSPPPEVLANYQAVTKQAQNVAATPYQSYGGPLVAGVNGQQTTGINAVNSASGIQNPYNSAATGLASSATNAINPQQFSGEALNQYLNPYQNDVIKATETELQNQNEQQSAGLTGNAISSGAFGGDRAGVAQAALAGQQKIANNATIAGLNTANYQNAQSEFNNQQGVNLSAQQANAQRGLGAAQLLGNLGQAAQNEALTGANAQVNAGTLQQKTQQAQDTAKYNQFIQEQAYPFQTTGWLSNIVEGIGSQSGGTNTEQQTQTASNTGSIVGGLLGLASFLNRGGRVIRKAGGGGLVAEPYEDPTLASLGGGSYVPTVGALQVGHTMPTGQGAGGGTAANPSGMQNAGQIGKSIQGLGNAFTNSSLGDAFSDFTQDLPGMLGFANGGLVGRKGYDDGGSPTNIAGNVDYDPSAYLTPTSNPNASLLGAEAKLPIPQSLVGPAVIATPPAKPAVDLAPEPSPMPVAGLAAAPAVKTAPSGGGLAGPVAASGTNSGYAEPVASKVNVGGLSQKFADKLQDLQQDAADAGIPSTVQSGWRDYDLQAKLYANYQAKINGKPLPYPGVSNGGIAAPPGSSYHEKGLAGDVAADNYAQQPGLIALGNEPWRGLKNLASIGDPVHFQDASGAVAGQPMALASSGNAGASGGAGLASATSTSPNDMPSPGSTPAQSVTDAPNGLLGMFHLSDAQRQGMLAAGLGMMAGTSRNGLVNIGQGGLQGIKAYNDARGLQSEIDLRRADAERKMVETGLLPAKTASEIGVQQSQVGLNSAGAARTAAETPGVAAESELKKTQVKLLHDSLGDQAKEQKQKADNVAATADSGQAPAIVNPSAPTVAPAAVPAVRATGAPVTSNATSAPTGGRSMNAAQSPAQTASMSDPAAAYAAGARPNPDWDLTSLSAQQAKLTPLALAGLPGAKENLAVVAQKIHAIQNGEPVPWSDGVNRIDPGVAQSRTQQAGAMAGAETAARIAQTAPVETKQRIAVKDIEEAHADANNAQNAIYRLQEMNEQVKNLPTKGFLIQGAFATERGNIARQLNTVAQMFGGQPVADPSNVAALEELAKDKFRLGAELSKSIGGKEPGFIVQNAVTANPGAENSAVGYKRIVAGLMQSMRYKNDYANFINQYYADHGETLTAPAEFQKTHPTLEYVERAIASSVAPNQAEWLKKNINTPGAVAAFDKQYGHGAAAILAKRNFDISDGLQ